MSSRTHLEPIRMVIFTISPKFRFRQRHDRQTRLSNERISFNRGRLLISRSVTGRPSGLTGARSTVDQSPSFAVESRYAGPNYFGDPDDGFVIAAVIEKGFIALLHSAKIVPSSVIAYASPAGLAFGDKVRPRIRDGSCFTSQKFFMPIT